MKPDGDLLVANAQGMRFLLDQQGIVSENLDLLIGEWGADFAFGGDPELNPPCSYLASGETELFGHCPVGLLAQEFKDIRRKGRTVLIAEGRYTALPSQSFHIADRQTEALGQRRVG